MSWLLAVEQLCICYALVCIGLHRSASVCVPPLHRWHHWGTASVELCNCWTQFRGAQMCSDVLRGEGTVDQWGPPLLEPLVVIKVSKSKFVNSLSFTCWAPDRSSLLWGAHWELDIWVNLFSKTYGNYFMIIDYQIIIKGSDAMIWPTLMCEKTAIQWRRCWPHCLIMSGINHQTVRQCLIDTQLSPNVFQCLINNVENLLLHDLHGFNCVKSGWFGIRANQKRSVLCDRSIRRWQDGNIGGITVWSHLIIAIIAILHCMMGWGLVSTACNGLHYILIIGVFCGRSVHTIHTTKPKSAPFNSEKIS